jgi:hypothetical protein
MSNYRKIVRQQISHQTSSGINVAFYPKTNIIEIDGFYDSCVHIEGNVFRLREFFDLMNITMEDCEEAFGKKSSKVL